MDCFPSYSGTGRGRVEGWRRCIIDGNIPNGEQRKKRDLRQLTRIYLRTHLDYHYLI